MKLSVTVPELGMGIRQARVSSWNVDAHDTIAFGDVVCVLQVREWEMAGRTKDASRLSRLRGRSRSGGPERMRCPSCGDSDDPAVQIACQDCLRFQMIANEQATVQTIRAQPGDQVRVGDLLAVVETPGDEAPGENLAPMRLIVDMIDRAEDGV